MDLLKEAKGGGEAKIGLVARPPNEDAPPGLFWASDVRFASIFVPPTRLDLKRTI